MLVKFFHSYYPSRIIYLLLVTAVAFTAMLYVTDDVPLSVKAWQRLGSHLGDVHSIYADTWDNSGPLYGWLVYVLQVVFNGHRLAYAITGVVIMVAQAISFSVLSNNHRIARSTYLFSVLYVFYFLGNFFLVYVSPQLMGMTFILWAFNQLLHLTTTKKANLSRIFNIGLLVGVATLFYFPYILFIGLFVMGLISFITPTARQIFNAVLGTILPLLVAALYYYFNGDIYGYLKFYIWRSMGYYDGSLIDWEVYRYPVGFLLFWIIWAVISRLSDHKTTNYESKTRYFFVLWIIAVILGVVVHYRRINYFDFILIAPPVVYFLTLFLLQRKKAFFREAYFVLIIGGLLTGTIYFGTDIFMHAETGYNHNSGQIHWLSSDSSNVLVNRKIVNAEVKQLDRKGLVRFHRVLEVYQPERIIDNEQYTFRDIYNRATIIRKTYRKEGEYTYIRKK